MITGSHSIVISLLLEHGTLSRAQLARLSGFSRAAITLVVSELLESGILVETGKSRSTGGRKPVMLRLGGRRHFVAGISVTRRTILLSRVDLDGRTVNQISRSTPPSTHVDDIVTSIAHGVMELFADCSAETLLGCGVSISSMADAVSDTISSSLFHWTDVPFRSKLERILQVPTFVIDNAYGAALGELWLHGRELRENLIYCYLGSGVGGAVIIGRDLFFGRNHAAGELGPFIVDIDGPLFPCGHRGCLEGFTSDPHLIEHFHTLRQHGHRSAIPDDIHSGSLVDAVSRASREGDGVANEIMAYAARYVGVACANLINFLNPDEIIIGGPFARWGTRFAELVADAAKDSALAVPCASVRILPGQKEETTIPLGAAAYVIKQAAVLLGGRQTST